VAALARGDEAEALSIARRIADPHQCVDALKHYAEARARRGDLPGALAVAEGLRNLWLRSVIIAGVAVTRAKSSDVDGALDSARRIPDPATRQKTFGAIAIALAQNANPAAALAVVESNIPDLRSSFGARVEVAMALAKSGDLLAARTILSSLQEKVLRLEPDPTLQGFARLEFLESRGMAHAKIGSTYARMLDPEGMADFLRTVDRPLDRAAYLASLAAELARAGRREQASRALSEALEIAAAIPDARERAGADTPLAQAEAALGDFAAVRHRASSQPTHQHKIGLLEQVSTTLCAMGNYSEALRMVAEIPLPGARVRPLLSIADALAGKSR